MYVRVECPHKQLLFTLRPQHPSPIGTYLDVISNDWLTTVGKTLLVVQLDFCPFGHMCHRADEYAASLRERNEVSQDSSGRPSRVDERTVPFPSDEQEVEPSSEGIQILHHLQTTKTIDFEL